MGAVVAAALASGLPFDEVRRRSLGLRRKDVAPFDPLALVKGMFARALIPAAALRRTIERLVPAKRFAHLKIPLTVTATDLDSGELVLFRDDTGPLLHDALYASCALPLYFPPLETDGRRLADGGLRAVLPLEPARALAADLVVAVHVGPGFDEEYAAPSAALRRLPPPLIRAHGEAIRIMMAEQAERAVADWPKDAPRLVYVRAVAEREATFAVERLEYYVEAGYQATRKAIA